MVCKKTNKAFSWTPVTWMLPSAQLVGFSSRSTSMSKYVALWKRKHNPLVWCWRGLITFVALRIHFKRGATSAPAPETSKSTEAVISHPLHPLLLTESGIMTLTGTLHKKVVISRYDGKAPHPLQMQKLNTTTESKCSQQISGLLLILLSLIVRWCMSLRVKGWDTNIELYDTCHVYY